MITPSPEERNLVNCNFQLIQQEAGLMETRLRRKMIIKPKRSVALPTLHRSNPILLCGRAVQGQGSKEAHFSIGPVK